jgi:hypothetical protein
VCFPDHIDTVLRLKHTEPLVVQMRDLVPPDFGWGFDGALAYAIFCKARGLNSRKPATRIAFLAQDPTLQTAVGAVKAVMKERGGDPLLLVLDDITDLGGPDFEEYFKYEMKSNPLHRAMNALSLHLQRLHAILGLFVYCTGRSLWLTVRALSGSGSPLLVEPTLLQPLTAADIVESLSETIEPDGQPLLGSMGLQPDMVDYFASRVQALTGGIGRTVQFVVRGRQTQAMSSSHSLLQSHEDVDAALERLQSGLAQFSSSSSELCWSGTLMGHAKTVSGANCRSSCVHASPGLSYGPASVPASDEPGTATDGDTRGAQLRLIAGEWLIRSLLAYPVGLDHPALVSTVQLLATMRTIGGTMRGRPFELLCANTLCFRSLVQPGADTPPSSRGPTLRHPAGGRAPRAASSPRRLSACFRLRTETPSARPS